MRCPDCNKFASYDEPEVDSDGDPTVTADVNGQSVTFTLEGSVTVDEC